MDILINILWGLGAIIVLMGLAYLLSLEKKAINFRTVLGALAIQILTGAIFLSWTGGQEALQWISGVVVGMLGAANEGIAFLFGGLEQTVGGHVFFINVLSVIIFFAAFMGILWYIGFMPLVVNTLGLVVSKVLGLSRAESVAATANIFVGITESPLSIKPYLANMTRSELFTVMTVGLGTVAGSVLAGLVSMGTDPGYLIVASFMAAPAGIVMAKIVIPETETPETNEKINLERDSDVTNVVDAAAKGTTDGLKLALNIGAMVLAFVSLVGLVNIGLGIFNEGLTLELIMGYVFAPFAFLIGVPWEQAPLIGQMIGEKTILNEFIAFGTLNEAIASGAITDPRIIAIATFALCGFANIGTVAILIGGLGALVPSRRGDIAKYGPRALLAAILANLMNGAIAGMMIF
ncbi:NupC/NupG family nucleoside CNT transporter [Geomicrobium sediminis]|uniref:CNT family concentrative nucleoside transporter n=1 Tax=Geomicrobium sediminis TaxID=1347788 RepID=A0ABS2P958_9BACL|nr:nucleoside transporter C-terminal domain-containing protein [Geomicrobium sediminis]MBM7631944.1 CNT family concentrative nucleoside transporter [Geomicrobium sediminis]